MAMEREIKMVGFCLVGGIGDAILLSPVIRDLGEKYGGVEVVIYDTNVSAIMDSLKLKYHIIKYDGRISTDRQVSSTHDLLKTRGISLAVWSAFRKDHEGFCNLFIAVDDSVRKIVDNKRDIYYRNLSKDMGKDILPAKIGGDNFEIIKFMSVEKDYYAQWRRFGIDVSHSDICFDVPEIKNDMLNDIVPYCILHDSRMSSDGRLCTKSWYRERWEVIVPYLKDNYGLNVIHFQSNGQTIFKGCLSSNDFLPKNKSFWDYFDLLRRSELYIGTDSWPAHAAIVLPKLKSLVLKGSVCYKLDHFSNYSSIIRKGECQCCEYLYLENCVFRDGKKTCMDEIKIEDVKDKIDSLMKV